MWRGGEERRRERGIYVEMTGGGFEGMDVMVVEAGMEDGVMEVE